MAASERIESYIDLSSIGNETVEFLKYIDQLEERINALRGIKLKLDAASTTKEIGTAIASANKGLAEYTDTIKKVEQAEVKLSESARKATTATNENTAAKKKSNEESKEAVATESEVVEKWLDQVKAVKNVQSSYNDLINQLIGNKERSKDLQQQVKLLNVAYKEGAITEQQYRDNLTEVTSEQLRLKVSTDDLNRALRNATKEQEALTGSANEQRARLNQLLQVYDAMSKADVKSPIGQQLKKDIDIITASITEFEQDTGRFQRQVGNYGSATKVLDKGINELRKQLQSLIAAGNGSAETIEQLTKQEALLSNIIEGQARGFASATAQVKDNEKALQAMREAGLQTTQVYQELLNDTADLKDSVADLKAEIKNLGSDTKTLDGLVGTAQLLAGAYAVATETAQLFGSSQEEAEEATRKSAAVIAVLTGLQSIQNALQKESSTLLFLSTVQTKAAAAATAIYSFATAGATAATKVLRATLVATGFGAILVVLGFVVSKLMEFADSANNAAEKQKALNDATKGANEALANQVQALNRVNEALNRSLKDQLAAAESQGASQQKILDLKDKIAAKEKEQAANTLKTLGLTESKVIELEVARQIVAERQQKAQERLRKATENNSKKQIEAANLHIESLQSEADLIDSVLVPGREALNALNEKSLEVETLRGERMLYNISEMQKSLQIERIGYELRAAAAASIVEDENKSYAERIKAAENFRNIQNKLAQSEANEALLDPSLSPKAKALAQAQANAAITKANNEFAAKELALMKERADRLAAAQDQQNQTSFERNKRKNEAILNDENLSYQKRLDAAFRLYELEAQAISDNLAIQLRNTALLDEEREALTVAAAEKSQALTVQYGLKQLELIGYNERKVTEVIEEENARRIDVINKGQADALIALNQSLSNGNISIEEYSNKRKDIEDKFRLDSVQEDVRAAFAKVMATKDGTKERFDAEKELADKTLALSELVTTKEIENQKKVADMRKQLAGEAYKTLISFVDAGFENSKNKIAEEEAAAEKANVDELKRNEALGLSTEEQAQRAIVINARAQLQKEQFARRQKEIQQQQARFQRAQDIGSIISSTSVAVMAALGSKPYTPLNIGLAAGVAAIGALQLARTIATPIPKYKYGTGPAKHSGGPAWTGDGYVHEPIILPSGEVLFSPNKPTLMDLPKGTTVLPSIDDMNEDMMNMTLANMARNSAPIDSNQMIQEMIKASEAHSRRIENAIRKKKTAIVNNTYGGVIVGWLGTHNYIEYNQRLNQSN